MNNFFFCRIMFLTGINAIVVCDIAGGSKRPRVFFPSLLFGFQGPEHLGGAAESRFPAVF